MWSVRSYFIVGSVNCDEPLVVLKDALEAGITMFQLREKGDGALTGAAYEAFARECQALCRRYRVPFIINDDIALAEKLDADGIHVGQEDASFHAYRAQYPQKIVGVSIHTLRELEQAITDGASYVGIGPIFHTTSKQDVIQSSLTFLQKARNAFPHIPVVAIGGITTENARLVRQAGADGIAVIREIVDSKNIVATVQNL